MTVASRMLKVALQASLPQFLESVKTGGVIPRTLFYIGPLFYIGQLTFRWEDNPILITCPPLRTEFYLAEQEIKEAESTNKILCSLASFDDGRCHLLRTEGGL